MITHRKIQDLLLQSIPGMRLGTLGRVLVRNGVRVDLRHLGRLAYLLMMGAYNSYVALLENACDGADIAGTAITHSPIFIIGHWRSGTTHLHHLLRQDVNFTCCTLYQASFPHHFVYSQPWGARIMNRIAPKKRPMDNVALFAHAPHEDEFALAALTGVSPYMQFWFPRAGDQGYSALDPRELPRAALNRWKNALVHFLRKITFSTGGKRIILKSPPHLGRVETLLALFPGARFIHICRNPYEVYLSTRKLWRDGISYSHLQQPHPDLVEEIIFSWYTRLFALFERDRGLIPVGALAEVRFEDLVARPGDSLAKIYEDLQLPDFDPFWINASRYLQSIGEYRRNEYTLDEESRARVNRRWRPAFERYGYPLEPVGEEI
jgi:omega-hydroxy-beta-dihydromenaquinone-9 sulfotransferase